MNDKGYTSTLPIYDRYPGVSHAQTHRHAHTHKHTNTHALAAWPRALRRFITQGKEKRKSFADECSKDSNPVKGDTQPNPAEHLYGKWGVMRVVMT